MSPCPIAWTSVLVYRTGVLSEICHYCRRIITWTTTPEFKNPITWHGEAQCVANEEPSRKMGGPA